MKIDFKQIGYYKYKTKNNPNTNFINEYPIHEGILNYIKSKQDSIELEFQDSKPKKINNKFVVLI